MGITSSAEGRPFQWRKDVRAQGYFLQMIWILLDQGSQPHRKVGGHVREISRTQAMKVWAAGVWKWLRLHRAGIKGEMGEGSDTAKEGEDPSRRATTPLGNLEFFLKKNGKLLRQRENMVGFADIETTPGAAWDQVVRPKWRFQQNVAQTSYESGLKAGQSG